MADCLNYEFYFRDILFPPVDIIYQTCLPRDKTILFSVSLFRLFFIYLIYLEVRSNFLMRIIFMLYLLINIGLVINMFIKKSKFN